MAKSTNVGNAPITERGSDGRPHMVTDMNPSDPKQKSDEKAPPAPIPIRTNPD